MKGNRANSAGFAKGLIAGVVATTILALAGALVLGQGQARPDPLRVDEQGNVQVNGTMAVNGAALITGAFRALGAATVAGPLTSHGTYVQNDNAPVGYEVSPRYHLSLTGSSYSGKTKAIPQDVLEALCGDQDGCEVRLGMTRWDNATETETASVPFLFYYSAANGRWRISDDPGNGMPYGVTGVDGDNNVNHARNVYATCYFTDGLHPGNNAPATDTAKGMYLLLWNMGGAYTAASRTCELTLID